MTSLHRIRLFFALTLLSTECSFFVHCENEVCTRETCPETFSYPQDLDWDRSDLGEVWSWLKNQMKKEAVVFCKDMKSEEVMRENGQVINLKYGVFEPRNHTLSKFLSGMNFNLENGNLKWDNLDNRHYKPGPNVGNLKVPNLFESLQTGFNPVCSDFTSS